MKNGDLRKEPRNRHTLSWAVDGLYRPISARSQTVLSFFASAMIFVSRLESRSRQVRVTLFENVRRNISSTCWAPDRASMTPLRPVRSGERSLGLGSQMPGLRASHLELPLEIGQGHVQVAHGHVWIDVTK